nr:hypothetical protein [Tanacetum cinerariifolium]
MEPIDMVLELRGRLLELSRSGILLVVLEEDPKSPQERLQGNPESLLCLVSGAETHAHTPAPGESKAQNGLPDLILSSEPKPLMQHMPRPPQSVWSPADMSLASSAVTYASVDTDSEPGKVFWGADEELSDGGFPRVIVYGYDGLPMLPPLPPVVSPTAESPGYVTKSDLEEDPKEYEDDETEDGPVGYPMDGGDDDDVDSSGDDTDDEDEDKEDEEEHLAPTDSAIVIPTDELVALPEGTKPIIPPPSTDIATTGARITFRLQAAISFPP